MWQSACENCASKVQDVLRTRNYVGWNHTDFTIVMRGMYVWYLMSKEIGTAGYGQAGGGSFLALLTLLGGLRSPALTVPLESVRTASFSAALTVKKALCMSTFEGTVGWCAPRRSFQGIYI